MVNDPRRRVIKAQRQPEAQARLEAGRKVLRETQIQMAKDLNLVEETGHFLMQGYGSIGEFGVRLGLDPSEAIRLAGLGRALRSLPQIEEGILKQEIRLEKAAIYGVIAKRPDAMRPEDDWLGLLRHATTRELRDKVRQRIAEADLAASGVIGVTVYVTEKTKANFDRCRTLASRKEGKALSDDQTFVVVVNHYLDDFDPDRVKPGTRRLPDTRVSTRNRNNSSRYVPAEVERRLREVSGDRCEVPDCENKIFIEKAHDDAHANGGSREFGNLYGLCFRHHTAADAGLIEILGRDENSRAVFRMPNGEVVRHPPPLGPTEATGPP